MKSEEISYHEPDAVLVLYINAPLRKAAHIEEAVNTLAIFDVESVVSVCEELAPCYTHALNGLVPISNRRDFRVERKSIYKENGAIMLSRVGAITPEDFLGKKVGHIVMLPEESIKINTEFEFWLAQKIMTEWETAQVK